MKIKNIVTVFLVAIVLVSCAPASISTPTETLVPIETLTPVLPTPTIMPIPPIESLPETQKSVSEFVSALNVAGISITAEQILQQGLTIKNVTGVDGKTYQIAVTSDGYPLMVKVDGNEWEKPTLKFLRMADLESGTSGTYFNETGMPPGLEQLALSNYGSFVTEWDLIWSRLEKTEGNINTSRVSHTNGLAKQAEENGGEVIAGNLIYWEGYPDWLTSGNYSQTQLEDYVKGYFITIHEKFPALSTWIVINEYHNLSKGWHDDFLQKKLGYRELLKLAFESAQAVNPGGVLIYNDGHNHTMKTSDDTNGGNWKESKENIDYLKSVGIKNLAVGMHMHLDAANPPSKEDMVVAMRNYGVPVYITELDVNLKDIKGSERMAVQAKIYADVLAACLESGACKYFGTWGTFDGNSWLEVDSNVPGYSKDADATLFDDNLAPKLAFFAVMRELIR